MLSVTDNLSSLLNKESVMQMIPAKASTRIIGEIIERAFLPSLPVSLLTITTVRKITGMHPITMNSFLDREAASQKSEVTLISLNAFSSPGFFSALFHSLMNLI